jgi:hypothetical protein
MRHKVVHVRCGAHMLHRMATAGLEAEHAAVTEMGGRDPGSARLQELLDSLQTGPNKAHPILGQVDWRSRNAPRS